MSAARRGRGVLCAALALAALSGCDSSVVMTAGPPPPSYGGALWVPPDPRIDLWEDPGAAGLVTDCDFGDVGGTSTTPFTGGEVGGSPADALQEAHDEGAWDAPIDLMHEVRADQDRVLYAYAADGRTKQAAIVHYGPAAKGTGAGKDGLAWYVESWSRCDVAEYPDEVTDDLDYEFWSDAAGRRRPITEIVSYSGGDCVTGTRFLELGRRGQDPVTYVANGNSWPDYFAEPYRRDVPLPADAVDSGLTHDGEHLWFSPDRKRAYVGDEDHVGLWPRTVQTLGCA